MHAAQDGRRCRVRRECGQARRHRCEHGDGTPGAAGVRGGLPVAPGRGRPYCPAMRLLCSAAYRARCFLCARGGWRFLLVAAALCAAGVSSQAHALETAKNHGDRSGFGDALAFIVVLLLFPFWHGENDHSHGVMVAAELARMLGDLIMFCTRMTIVTHILMAGAALVVRLSAGRRAAGGRPVGLMPVPPAARPLPRQHAWPGRAQPAPASVPAAPPAVGDDGGGGAPPAGGGAAGSGGPGGVRAPSSCGRNGWDRRR